MGKYQLPYSWPHAGHRGLERLYNFVWPELAKALGVPGRNIKLSAWSAESGYFTIKISNPKTEVDMVEMMAPKALKGLLEKCGFREVTTRSGGVHTTKPTVKGTTFQVVEAHFSTKYPEQWLEWDKQRFGR